MYRPRKLVTLPFQILESSWVTIIRLEKLVKQSPNWSGCPLQNLNLDNV